MGMISYVVEGEIGNNHHETVNWAKELCAHINSLDPDNPCHVLRKKFGSRHKIAFIQNFESLAHLEKFHAQLAEDDTYQDLMSRKNLAKNGTVKDHVYEFITA